MSQHPQKIKFGLANIRKRLQQLHLSVLFQPHQWPNTWLAHRMSEVFGGSRETGTTEKSGKSKLLKNSRGIRIYGRPGEKNTRKVDIRNPYKIRDGHMQKEGLQSRLS